ncbi:MAG: FolC protein [Erysipelotrichaceae bacterium]|nr:FolC protein [Erysipelotrichaceae bacterium]
MFDNIQEAVAYIEGKRHKRTVEEFRKTLESLQINMAQKNMIHIGGTNGKGSTVNYLRAILNAHGYRVGTFTSPYLVCHNDRIRIDDEPISDDDLLKYINRFYDVIEREDMSMFEIDVMIMLAYFDEQDLDYRIIECGIGGKNDKTNVIDSTLSAITNIGLDHLEQIGPTLYDVINEKMGIIQPHQIFVTSEISGTIIARLQEQCDVMEALMVVVPEYDVDEYPITFAYRNMFFKLKTNGIYQATNARLALTIAHKLITLNPTLTVPAVEDAIWQGRYEELSYNGKRVVIDGAHNIPAIESLIKSIKFDDGHPAIVFSCLKEKSAESMVSLLQNAGLFVYLTTFDDERVIDLSKIATNDIQKVVPDYRAAIKEASSQYDYVIVTGSLHFISIVRRFLQEMK